MISGRQPRSKFISNRHCYRVHATPLMHSQSISQSEKSASSSHGMEDANWNGDGIDTEKLVNNVKFNDNGLVAAIAQQWDTNEVLMMAWMSAESIRETMLHGRVVYYSRSRQTLWRKGDTSGQVQHIRDMLLDCDGDTLLLKVDQKGVACHTGRRSCFYTGYRPPTGSPEVIADILMDPNEMYKTDDSSK